MVHCALPHILRSITYVLSTFMIITIFPLKSLCIRPVATTGTSYVMTIVLLMTMVMMVMMVMMIMVVQTMVWLPLMTVR